MVAREIEGAAMQGYEYRVVPAPRRGEKARGARSVADRFAVALMHVMNDLGRDGWEYLRADTLPCEERVGLTGTATHFQHLLVFRRALAGVSPAAGAAMAAARHAPPDDDETTRLPAPPLVADRSVPAPGSAPGPAIGPAPPPPPATRPNVRI